MRPRSRPAWPISPWATVAPRRAAGQAGRRVPAPLAPPQARAVQAQPAPLVRARRAPPSRRASRRPTPRPRQAACTFRQAATSSLPSTCVAAATAGVAAPPPPHVPDVLRPLERPLTRPGRALAALPRQGRPRRSLQLKVLVVTGLTLCGPLLALSTCAASTSDRFALGALWPRSCPAAATRTRLAGFAGTTTSSSPSRATRQRQGDTRRQRRPVSSTTDGIAIAGGAGAGGADDREHLVGSTSCATRGCSERGADEFIELRCIKGPRSKVRGFQFIVQGPRSKVRGFQFIELRCVSV